MTRATLCGISAIMALIVAISQTDLHAAPAVEAASPLRVMSFNLRVRNMMDLFNGWSSRREIAAEAIRQFQPDVLATQECLDEQARDLLERLPGYRFVGAGRKNGRLSGGEMCAIFYRADRFHLVSHGHLWLSSRPDKPGSKSFGSWWPRMATWAKLQPRTGGEAVYVFNTHLDISGEKTRDAQARVLRQQIERIAGSAPVIVTGDFNTTEDSPTYRTLLGAAAGLSDSYRTVHTRVASNERTHHGFGGKTHGQRIDWILTSRHFHAGGAAIVRHERNGKFPSDHFPITAVLSPTTATAATTPETPTRVQ